MILNLAKSVIKLFFLFLLSSFCQKDAMCPDHWNYLNKISGYIQTLLYKASFNSKQNTVANKYFYFRLPYVLHLPFFLEERRDVSNFQKIKQLKLRLITTKKIRK